jgi:hypothetical protein
MTMARTLTEKEAAATRLADRLAGESDERTWRDAEPLHRVAAAFSASVTADTELGEAVAAARTAGCSWASIAAMLGVSKQTAQARYGTPRAGA